jgi:hypothetical protein
MKIDKQLYHNAYEQYRQWNLLKEDEQIRTARQRSPLESWQQYVALLEFCWQLSPHQNDWERKQKLESIDRYYARVRQMEAWRKARAKAA